VKPGPSRSATTPAPAWSGQIPDLNTLEMDAKLEEADRGRVVLARPRSCASTRSRTHHSSEVSQVSALAELSTEYPFNRSFGHRPRF